MAVSQTNGHWVTLSDGRHVFIEDKRDPSIYARFVEFGTSTMPAQSFIRAPFQSSKSSIYDYVARKLKTAISSFGV